MIAFVMLSNKSQYILSKIGIPLFQDVQNISVNDVSSLHFFQKDNILTLHANSVDEYSEKEIKLLEAIIKAIHGTLSAITQGSIDVSSAKSLDLKNFSELTEIKATLIFCNFDLCSNSMNPIKSPSLQEMLNDPSLKKDLWKKLKPLQSGQ
tara:strand:+ start:271 stop:723 length:453 start_codon:yes stop_codon:yes gene_type:complete